MKWLKNCMNLNVPPPRVLQTNAPNVLDNVWYCSHFAQLESLSILKLEQPAIINLIKVNSNTISAVMWHTALRAHRWYYGSQHHGKHNTSSLCGGILSSGGITALHNGQKQMKLVKERPEGNQIASRYLKSTTSGDIFATIPVSIYT